MLGESGDKMFDLENFIIEKERRENTKIRGKSFSRKELKNLGLTDYSLSKAVADEKIIKVARGVYKFVDLQLEKEEQEELTAEDIYNLVLKREYAKLNKLLYGKDNGNVKLYRMVLKLIKAKERISCLIVPTITDIKYQSNEYDRFGRFFEALKYGDYEEAYKFVFKCEESSAKYSNNVLDFKIYELLLKDILIELKTTKEKIKQNEFNKSINKKLKDFIYQRDFDEEALDELWDLISEKLEYYPQNEEKYLKLALNLIESIWMVSDNKISKDYFGKVVCHEEKLLDRFFCLLQYGDYNSCYEIVNTTDWKLIFKELQLKKYFVLYKKLLFKFNSSLSKGVKTFELTRNYDTKLNDDSNFFTVLKVLINNNCYEEAYMYYKLCSNNFLISESLNNDLALFFAEVASLDKGRFVSRTLSKKD